MADLPQIRSVAQPWVLLTALAAGLVIYVVYYRLLHPLAKFPGPLSCSLSNYWKLRATWNDRLPEELSKLHEQYGPVVRVGCEDLSFNSPEAIADIYKKGWRKGEFYEGFAQRQTGLFSTRDEKDHAQRKRVYSLAFAPPSLRSMEGLMDSRYAILRRQLDRFAATGETFDLRHYMTYCIVDILGELAFGSDLGNQMSEDPKKIPPVSEAIWFCCLCGQAPWMASVFRFARDKFPTAKVREFLVNFNSITPVAAKTIKKRQESGVQRNDMLGRIMTTTEEKTGQPFTQGRIIMEAVTLITGGTQTTGNTLHVLFANLFRNPRSLERVVREIDSTLPSLKGDEAAYPILGLEEKLDFVNMAIKENYRKDAVGSFNMARTVPESGAHIAGYAVPPGAQVFANIPVLHHNLATWGADHNLYDPDRFYDSRAKDLKEYVVPFSVGKRACVGQNLAVMNIFKMTTTLLKAYTFECLNADEPMRVVCHGDSGLQTPLLVKCTLRGEPFQG